MTQQRHRVSFLETCLSTAIGYGVALATNMVVLPLFGFPVSFPAANGIAVIFTAISILRGFLVRRLFVYLHDREILR